MVAAERTKTSDGVPEATAWPTISKEHHGIRKLAAALEATLESSDFRAGGDTPPDYVLASKFGALWGLLVVHFAGEEKEAGFFSHLRAALPQRAQRIDALLKEHGEYLREIQDLVAAIALLAEPSERPRFLVRAKVLFRRLREHESRENELAHESAGEQATGLGAK